MTYKEHFIFCVKSQGRILREKEGGVELPFGEDYSILLKNLESRRALVKVEIDGKSIGKQLIVEPNNEIEVERFLEDLNTGNKFRFIQKTKEVVEHRGDRIDDGVIRVEVWFEKQIVTQEIHHNHIHHYDYTCPWCHCYPCRCWHWPRVTPFVPITPPCTPWFGTVTAGGLVGNVTLGNITCSNSVVGSSENCVLTSSQFVAAEPSKDEGITVKGEVSNQPFRYGTMGTVESFSTVLTLKLYGYKDDKVLVSKPLTVKDKLECSSCGKTSSSDQKFCGSCGTFLS